MKCIPDEDWTVEITGLIPEMICPVNQRLQLNHVRPVQIQREKHACIPMFHEAKWLSGQRFNALLADECSLSYALVPDSVQIEDKEGRRLINGMDYYCDVIWGAFGRTPDSCIGPEDTVYVSYEYYPYRLDSIVIDADGQCRQKIGIVKGATPLPPELDADEFLIGNIFFDRNRKRLSNDMLFPCIEAYIPPEIDMYRIEQSLARTLYKLRNGKPVKILAWGDSVTACKYILDEKKRWLNILVDDLRQRFPASEINLINLGWPGKSMNAFLNEPPGTSYNYMDNVLGSDADLVTIEFVNDAGMSNEQDFQRVYQPVGEDLKRKGIDVIAILPHPVRPDWMGISTTKGMASDPRPYSNFLRNWAYENQFAVADVSARFMHLWKEGIPYPSLMVNNINHPDARGMRLFAEVMSKLFPY